MSKRSPRLIVYHHKPLKSLLLGVLLVLLSGLAGWLLYQAGYERAGTDNQVLSARNHGLAEQVRALDEERAALKAQLAVLQRGQQIDQEAHSAVKDSLQTLQEKILELREEIAFYRGIVTPAEAETGLRVQSFKLEDAGQERLYHFKLVLTQVLTRDAVTKGQVELVVVGVHDGMPARLPLEKISVQPLTELNFRFRYFQKFEGDLLLPEGFTAREVQIAVVPAGKGARVERSFLWPAAPSA